MSSLYISELRLSHFRSHKRSTISCDARPVALYGRNGAGKTNILEAVSLFSPGRGLRRASAQSMGRRPESLGWKLNGTLQSLSHRHELEIWSDQGRTRQLKIDGKPTPQTRLGQIARVLWLIPSMDRLWIEGAEGRRRFLDRMALSFFPAHADASLLYERTMRERNRLLKDQCRDQSWFDALEHQMASSAEDIQRHRHATLEQLQRAQDVTETSFPVADLALHTEDGIDQTTQGYQLAFARNRQQDMIAGRTLMGPHRNDLHATYRAKGVDARDCSTGEQKALLISLILANARALISTFGAPPILLLDEVAAHLDAHRRAALYEEICTLKSQAWMTGTGLELFSELGENAQYFDIKDTDGISFLG